ncbi:hypothetical protein MRX96_037343 [Rhipicephalus microplus]
MKREAMRAGDAAAVGRCRPSNLETKRAREAAAKHQKGTHVDSTVPDKGNFSSTTTPAIDPEAVRMWEAAAKRRKRSPVKL